MTAAPDGELKMTLWEHLSELRQRLFRVVISALVLGAGSLVFARPIFKWLMLPVLNALPAANRSLIYTSGIEEINVLMKIGLYAGIFLTTPVILWQIWGFVSPGLYAAERRLAAPFVVLGTLAFLAGGAFCYLFLLPTMFQFLLQQEDAAPMEKRLVVARSNEEDALRALALGQVSQAAGLAKTSLDKLRAPGDGSFAAGDAAVKDEAELSDRLVRLGKVWDSARMGANAPGSKEALTAALGKKISAATSASKGDFVDAAVQIDDAASMTLSSFGSDAPVLVELWKLELALARGQAAYAAEAWTRPMLSMEEQLSLVLILLLALGIIFELPLVMALLALAGLVQAKTLFKYQRHALVFCLIAAAIITPTGDAVNLTLMAAPMLLCYEIGVLAVWAIEKRRGQKVAATPSL